MLIKQLVELKKNSIKCAGCQKEIVAKDADCRDAYLDNHKIKGDTLDKFEVMRILKISNSTYRRHVSKGLLKPMALGGVDIYYEKDLARALEESRRKGRF